MELQQAMEDADVVVVVVAAAAVVVAIVLVVAAVGAARVVVALALTHLAPVDLGVEVVAADGLVAVVAVLACKA